MEGKSGRPPMGRVAVRRDSTATIADAHAAIVCLARLTELMQRRRAQLAAGVGLTEQQCGVIEEIATEHFMPSLFARRRESSPAAVSKILRQLVDKGLILTAIADGDGRQRRYSLTSKGKRAMQRLREMREAAIHHVWLELDGTGMRAFTSFSERLVESLERYASAEQSTNGHSTKTRIAEAEVDPPAEKKE